MKHISCSDSPRVKLSFVHTPRPAWGGRGPCSMQTFCTVLRCSHFNPMPSGFARARGEHIEGNGAKGLKCFCSEVTHLKSTHILLAKASHIVMLCFKGGGKVQYVPGRREPEILANSRNVYRSYQSMSRYDVPSSWASGVAHSSWFAQCFCTFSSEGPMSPQSWAHWDDRSPFGQGIANVKGRRLRSCP